MITVHLHLILAHIPVVGTLYATVLFGYGLWRGSNDIKRAALGSFVLCGLIAMAVYLTGEQAANHISKIPTLSKPDFESHSDTAVAAITSVLVLATVAVAGLVRFRKSPLLPRWYSIVILTLGLITCGIMGWTANLGGKITHSEIRSDSSSSAPVP